jgi:hypothetical protein
VGQREPSERAKQALIDELRDAIGDEAVERADLDVDRAIDRHNRPATPEASRSRLMFVVIGVAGIVIAGIVALALESWIVLVALLVLHLIGTTIVVRTAFKATTDVEKPAPTTVALLEDEGVADPEGALNDLVAQATDRDDDSRAGRAALRPKDETDDVGDRAEDAARQQESITPHSRGESPDTTAGDQRP